MGNAYVLYGFIGFLLLFIFVGFKRYFKMLFELASYKEAVKTLSEELANASYHANLLEGQMHMSFADRASIDRLTNELNVRKAECKVLRAERATLLERTRTQDIWIKNLERQLAAAHRDSPQSKTGQFNKDEIKTLISLCHPDKHGGKESATKITQKLLTMR